MGVQRELARGRGGPRYDERELARGRGGPRSEEPETGIKNALRPSWAELR